MGVRDEIAAERSALAASLESVGPEAPTACGGWTAFDLAAHVVASEQGSGVVSFCVRTLAARGAPFRPDPRLVERAIARQRRRGYTALIDRLRRGGPRLLASRAVAASTLFELWMHHDDLTSANSLTHPAPAHLALAIPSLVRYQAKRLPAARLIVRTTENHEWHFGSERDRTVEITGSPEHLVRWLAGRQSAASLNVEADDALAERVRAFVGRIG